MSSKECEEQLKSLIYDWETEGLLTKIYATDIEAIKHLMLENQMQQDTIKTQKIVITNLKEVIDKAIEYLDDWLFNVGGMGACMEYKDIKEILEILKYEE